MVELPQQSGSARRQALFVDGRRLVSSATMSVGSVISARADGDALLSLAT